MWTPARSSDISKRPERQNVVFYLFAIVILLAGGWGLGCVVTDKIKFEDAVNHPISIEREQPTDNFMTGIYGESTSFSVIVQDEDVTDTIGGNIEGLLEIDAFNWPNPRRPVGECEDPQFVKPVDTEGEETPRFVVECTIENWASISDADIGDTLNVRLIVSDLGFVRSQPRQGATTAEISWDMKVQTPPQ
jgi:hypothetical protein